MGAVAKKKSADIIPFDYGADANSGYENQSSSDYQIPFLVLLQAMSPQCGDPEDGGVEGARPGMLFNSVTHEVFSGKDGVEFVPAYTEHLFLEWVPRDQGGGIVGRHTPDSEIVARAKANSDFGKYKTPSGNDLVEAFQIYGVLVGEDGDANGMAVISFTSTKIKVYKNIITKLRMFTIKTSDGRKINPPLFAHKLRISSFKDRNSQGEFHNFVVNPAVDKDVRASLIDPTSSLFEEAKQCMEMVKSGIAQADYASQTHEGSGTRSGGDAADDDIPF